jgi:type IV secretory pathway VirJ component
MRKIVICFLFSLLTPFSLAAEESPTFVPFSAIASFDAPPQKASAKGTTQPLPDLPLVEVPASGGNSNFMGILITGDGGWGITDRGVAQGLAAKGIPVVGLNSLHYFWSKKSVEQAAADLNRIIERYRALWNRSEIVIVGYSFGADVLPFMLNRIPAENLQKIKVISLLGLSSTADFQFHLSDWFGNHQRSTSQMVRPEVEKLRGKKILCFYGTEDDDALCGQLDPGLSQAIPLQSGHRFGRGFQPIVDAILKDIQ